MRRKAAALLLVAAATLPACREKGHPDPDIRMAVSHERAEDPGAGGASRPMPTRLEVPPEVEKAWSGIRLLWKDSTDGREGSLDVPLAGEATLPGSGLVVRADVFLPSFTMSSDVITSSGTEPENPAARITVSENGNPLFGGWVFTRFPDVHPFSHPRFSLRLEGGIPRKGA